jgi:dockerin type I repeat protein
MIFHKIINKISISIFSLFLLISLSVSLVLALSTDVNNDGFVNTSDLMAVISDWGKTDLALSTDVTLDQKVNGLDTSYIIHDLGSLSEAFYGVNAQLFQSRYLNYAPELANYIKDAGAGFGRIIYGWHYIEKTQGVFSWDKYDTATTSMTDAGLEILGIIDGTALWAALDEPVLECPVPYYISNSPDPISASIDWWKKRGPPEDIENWKNYVREIVGRYGYGDTGSKQIRYWEILSEQNKKMVFCGRAEDQYQLMVSAHEVIKDVDPTATVLFGGLSTTCLVEPEELAMLEEVLAYPDIGDYFDIYNIHIYGKIYSNPADGVNDHRDLLNNYDLGDKPIWVTETNPHSGSEASTAADLTSWHQALYEAGVKKIFWWPLSNSPDDINTKAYGFFSSEDATFENPTQVYNAYQLMTGATTSGSLY